MAKLQRASSRAAPASWPWIIIDPISPRVLSQFASEAMEHHHFQKRRTIEVYMGHGFQFAKVYQNYVASIHMIVPMAHGKIKFMVGYIYIYKSHKIVI